MFFCGHKPHCWVINGEEAFKTAKARVEKEYAVVGILEEFEKSLLVMEHYIPRFFAGVSDLYARRAEWQQNINKNIFRWARNS
jgi:dermatan/chondrotin sulfate uronyl 2-O-sulfotransferase UST